MYREMTKTHDVKMTNSAIMASAPSVFAEAPHHGCSNKYGFIPTINIVDALRHQGWYPVDATQKNVRDKSKRELTKHLVRFRRLDDDIIIGDSAVELLLTNSHDRSSGFVLHAGVFRMACANGIVVADSTFQKVSVRHSRYSAERIIEGAYEVVKEVPAITSSLEGMRAINLTGAEREVFASTALEYMMPEPKEGEKILTPDSSLVRQALMPKRSADQSTDLWTTYNVIQEKALRGGITTLKRNAKGRHRRNTSREVKSIDKNIKLNKALWEMAMQMKALKESA